MQKQQGSSECGGVLNRLRARLPLPSTLVRFTVVVVMVVLGRMMWYWSSGPVNRGLYMVGDQFYLDGRPFRILSGSFHYFRTHPAQWTDRLLKMKAAGLNVVDTYIPWNIHERIRGEYEFHGYWNIPDFIRQVDKVGLKLIVRPGPYICSEWELGGLPSWLLHDRNMTLRTSQCKPYLEAVKTYFDRLLPILAAYQYRTGHGPIIAFQVENEYGSFGVDNAYMVFLRDLYYKHGIAEILITSDGGRQLRNGSVSGAMMTINFMGNVRSNLQKLQKLQPNRPLMVMEFWAGWFDHWGEQHHVVAPGDIIDNTRVIIQDFNASMNFYMFVGGTNFGFMNGANNMTEGYGATVTSYDYDSPISETGDITPKFLAIQKVIQDIGVNPDLQPVTIIPSNSDKAAYGRINIQEYIDYNDMINLISGKKLKSLKSPVAMEYLDINNHGGQGYGFLLYRTKIARTSYLAFTGEIRDRAQIFLNMRHVGSFTVNDQTVLSSRLALPTGDGQNILDILVENMGRVNYYWARGNKKSILSIQRKGILGSVFADRGAIEGSWLHVPFEFDEAMVRELRGTRLWKPFRPQSMPAVYRAIFHIDGKPKDTFFFSDGWNKGTVLINGFNVGRYWKVGPQRTLYVPGPLLRTGVNDVIVFETEGVTSRSPPVVNFIDRPILG